MTDRAGDFRRFYRERRIEDQLAFYRSRHAEYAKAASQATAVRDLLLAAAAIAGFLTPFVTDTGRAVCGVTAAVLAALAAAVTAFEALIGFAPLTKLYDDTVQNLAKADEEWSSNAVPTEDLGDRVERVERVFRSENGQWGQLVVESDRQRNQS